MARMGNSPSSENGHVPHHMNPPFPPRFPPHNPTGLRRAQHTLGAVVCRSSALGGRVPHLAQFLSEMRYRLNKKTGYASNLRRRGGSRFAQPRPRTVRPRASRAPQSIRRPSARRARAGRGAKPSGAAHTRPSRRTGGYGRGPRQNRRHDGARRERRNVNSERRRRSRAQCLPAGRPRRPASGRAARRRRAHPDRRDGAARRP